jgi:hypothetical protein
MQYPPPQQPPPPYGSPPYQQPYGQQPPMGYGQPPMGFGQPVDTSDGGTQVLIWGVLGLALCAFCAPVAWVKGNSYVQTCTAMGVRPSTPGTVGRILGIIGTLFLILGVVGGGLSVCAQALAH